MSNFSINMYNDWKTDFNYNKDDKVFALNENFICLISHKSNVFLKDVQDFKYWKSLDRER